MANCLNDAKYIYFSMLGYEITMYGKHCEVLAKATYFNDQRNDARQDCSTAVRQIQEDTVNSDTYGPCTDFVYGSRGHITAGHKALAASNIERATYAPLVSDSDYEDPTDILFRSTPARFAYEMFILVLPNAGHKTAITWVTRADTQMTCVIGDLQRRLKVI